MKGKAVLGIVINLVEGVFGMGDAVFAVGCHSAADCNRLKTGVDGVRLPSAPIQEQRYNRKRSGQ